MYRKAAEQGYDKAQFNLSVMYHKGYGVKQDYGQELKWLRKAALQGFVEAQFNLGAMYYEGQGVKGNYAGAIRWFQMAANNGSDRAKEILSRLQQQLS